MKSKSNCIDSSVEWNKGVPFIPGCWSHSPRKVYIGCHNGWLSPMLQFERHGFNVALKLKYGLIFLFYSLQKSMVSFPIQGILALCEL